MNNYFMKKAYEEALKAKKLGEVPVGAVIIKNNRVIGRGFNLRESSSDPTSHAEIVAIKEASKKLKSWRLSGCTMYVTLEPCPMCAGALINSRIDKVVIGALDKRMGACVSAINLLQNDKLNHKVEIETNIMDEQCSKILTDFFKELRENKKINKRM